MSDDDDTRPIDADAPGYPAQPPYAMPLPPGSPAYGVPQTQTQAQQRPRFGDQVMGMWAVVAVAVACLVIGGLSGFILGRATGHDDRGFMRGPGMFQRSFPDGSGQNGFPNQPNGFSNQAPGQGQNGR